MLVLQEGLDLKAILGEMEKMAWMVNQVSKTWIFILGKNKIKELSLD